MSTFLKFVVIWFNTREYGGPEEGGWWFDTGESREVYTCHTESEVEVHQKQAEETVAKRNEGRRPIDSVVSTGRYSVTVEDEKPESYLAVTPHYE
jgi:hypothetical protein